MDIKDTTTEDDVKNNLYRFEITWDPREAPMSTRPQDWEEKARRIIFGSQEKHGV